MSVPTMVRCIICQRGVPLYCATPGSHYADGSQAFACDTHIVEGLGWAVAWALFDHDQRAAKVTA